MHCMKNPYDVIKRCYVTEKTSMLEGLSKDLPNRKKGSHCKDPKFVFVVDKQATKADIASAVEQIYSEKGVKVKKVNTIVVKPAPSRMFRGRRVGKVAGFKKAIVTLREGSSII